jgi:hypothetical protein
MVEKQKSASPNVIQMTNWIKTVGVRDITGNKVM